MPSTVEKQEVTPQLLWFAGAVCALLGTVILYLSSSQALDTNKLSETTGRIHSVWTTQSGKYSRAVRFNFHGNKLYFAYSPKSGAVDAVRDALRHSSAKDVTILYVAEQSFSPAFDDRTYHSVYAVSVDGQVIRSLDEVRASHERDNAVGFWIGTIFLAIGVVAGIAASVLKSAADKLGP